MNFQEGSYEPLFSVHYWLRFRRPTSKNEPGKVGHAGGPVGGKPYHVGLSNPMVSHLALPLARLYVNGRPLTPSP